MYRDRWRALLNAVVNLLVKICALLGYFAASSGNSLPTFRRLFFGFLTPGDGTDRLSRNDGKELTTTRCEITQKTAVIIYFAAEASNYAWFNPQVP